VIATGSGQAAAGRLNAPADTAATGTARTSKAQAARHEVNGKKGVDDESAKSLFSNL
jgi:hypothetical protein